MISLFAKIVRPGLMGLGRRDLQACGRDGIRDAGLLWHRKYKGFHFQRFAFAKYGYKRRSKKYEQQKQRAHPEAEGRPLVFTGDSERSARAGNTVHARAPSWERAVAEVIVNAPTLNYRQLHDEMTRVTVFEQRVLAEQFRSTFERRMVSLANGKSFTIQLTNRVA